MHAPWDKNGLPDLAEIRKRLDDRKRAFEAFSNYGFIGKNERDPERARLFADADKATHELFYNAEDDMRTMLRAFDEILKLCDTADEYERVGPFEIGNGFEWNDFVSHDHDSECTPRTSAIRRILSLKIV
jgi:hypothetical protein